MWKKLNMFLDDKFPEFSYGKSRFSICFHLLTLWVFAVSFPNGVSTSKYRTNILNLHVWYVVWYGLAGFTT